MMRMMILMLILKVSAVQAVWTNLKLINIE